MSGSEIVSKHEISTLDQPDYSAKIHLLTNTNNDSVSQYQLKSGQSFSLWSFFDPNITKESKTAILLSGAGYLATVSELFIYVNAQEYIRADFGIDPMEIASSAAISQLFSLFGNLISSYADSALGRHNFFLLAGIWLVIFSTASAFAPTFLFFIILRALSNMGTAGFVIVDYVFALEHTSRRKQGMTSAIINFFGSLSYILYSAIAWIVLPLENGWRWYVVLSNVPVLLVILLRYFLIDSDTPMFRELVEEQEHFRVKESIVQRFSTLSPLHKKRALTLGIMWFFQATAYWGLMLFLSNYLNLHSINMYIINMAAGCLQLITSYLCGYSADKGGSALPVYRLISFLQAASLCLWPLFSFSTPSLIASALFTLAQVGPLYTMLWLLAVSAFPTHLRATGLSLVSFGFVLPGLFTPFISSTLRLTWYYPLVWGGLMIIEWITSFYLDTYNELV